MFDDIDLVFYKEWYQGKVKDNLTLEQKKEVLGQISAISLREVIHVPRIEIEKSQVPLLSDLTALEQYSGRQLMVVMFCIVEELGLKTTPIGD